MSELFPELLDPVRIVNLGKLRLACPIALKSEIDHSLGPMLGALELEKPVRPILRFDIPSPRLDFEHFLLQYQPLTSPVMTLASPHSARGETRDALTLVSSK